MFETEVLFNLMATGFHQLLLSYNIERAYFRH